MPEDSAEMLRMQQDAIRRVRLMQARAQRSMAASPPAPPEPPPKPEPPHQPNDAPKPDAPRRMRLHRKKTPPESPQLFEKLLGGDTERTLLLVLLLVLTEEKTDITLILALLYLIL